MPRRPRVSVPARLRAALRRRLEGPKALRAADLAVRRGPVAGLSRLGRWLEAHRPGDPRALEIAARAWARLGRDDEASRLHAQRLRLLIRPKVAADDPEAVLRLMAEFETTGRAAPYAAGRMIADHMHSPKGRNRLFAAAQAARADWPDSVFLTHLVTLMQARQGAYHAAAADLVRRLDELGDAPLPEAGELRRKSLQNAWRVVDMLAREQMDWAMEGDDEAPHGAAPGEDAPEGADDGLDETADNARRSRLVGFKEHALQSRRREEYLDICAAEFAQAADPYARLAAVEDMLRRGIRHIPDYGPSHARAAQCLDRLLPALEPLFAPRTALPGRAEIEALCGCLRIARKLGRARLAARARDRLVALSGMPGADCALWEAAAVLAQEFDDQPAAARIMARLGHLTPAVNRDVRNYLGWAMRSHEHAAAQAFVDALPQHLKRAHGLLYHVHILQREGQLQQAIDLARDVHGQLLTNPLRAHPISNHTVTRRIGELRFLARTARELGAVTQPREPQGVVLILARNIDHLRSYPLMVLAEMKRRGWAVVPLVEGLLPNEPTGRPAIDAMNGAISPHGWLTPAAQRALPPVPEFRFAPERGRLDWQEIDLSHALWEDAAINRRRHSVDWSCPELQEYLGDLTRATRSVACVLEHAHALHRAGGLRVAIMGRFNYRLPDALPRFFCESRGDPEGFFFVHAANGYQNYFTNFSTNISQRFVLRNMTRHPQARSASFPLPENFAAYYEARRGQAPALVARFESVTRVTRSTAGQRARPPEAAAADARIAEWRARGGHVACAFGKVVCDSGVPFDGGPAHRDMRDWINHAVAAVQGSDTLLLIKPHPHEINNRIATFPTEYFADLIDAPLGENALLLGHRWFDMHDMRTRMDLGVIYNGTTAIELGIMGIPCLLAGHFAPIDYPIGHVVPRDRAEFEAYLRFERPARVPADIRERAAVWLDYMASESFTQPYRFHARPVTNTVVYPPFWFDEDLKALERGETDAVAELAGRLLGERPEPGGGRVLPFTRRATG